MRAVLLNTGTELLLGDVQDAHLAFIAREILPLGLRIDERRTVGDTEAIGNALGELISRCEILFVTGGLGPTSDDITREMVADHLELKLQQSSELLASLRQRLQQRGIKWTSGIARQADVPSGAEILTNQNGSAPGLYLRANINPRIQSPHLFLLPGPPRELQPMFRVFAIPILRSIVPASALIERRLYKIANMGESLVEKVIGDRVLAIPGIELGYCARPAEVDVRVVGKANAIEQADAIIRSKLESSIFSAADETLVCYANQAKIDMLNVDPLLIEKHGAVSEQVARALAEHARACAKTDFALATTGIAGPGGGSPEKPAGTVYIALARPGETVTKKFFFPTDRETFKQIAAQTALELLRRRLIAGA
jgi:nicotinamide-nucleotide amidase